MFSENTGTSEIRTEVINVIITINIIKLLISICHEIIKNAIVFRIFCPWNYIATGRSRTRGPWGANPSRYLGYLKRFALRSATSYAALFGFGKERAAFFMTRICVWGKTKSAKQAQAFRNWMKLSGPTSPRIRLKEAYLYIDKQLKQVNY